MLENACFPPKFRNRTRMFVFPLMEFLASTIRQDKEIKSIYIRKEELKLFKYETIMYVCRKFFKNPQKTAGTNE